MPRPANADAAVLSSWKEIACYLGKGVRTVQRWEAEFGLPVRRPGPDRHLVHASREELDAWLAHWTRRIERADNAEQMQLSAGVEASRALRKLQQQLVGELSSCVSALRRNCEQAVALSMAGHEIPRPERQATPADTRK